jgi:hypothetical protein
MRPFLIAVGALLLALNPASAVLTERSCDEPAVFNLVAVNIVVLPYEYVGVAAPAETGDRMSFLVQLETFFSAVKFGGVHVLRLVKSSKPCEPDKIFDELLGGKRYDKNAVRRGKALVVLWGRIFEQGEDVYVQSYLRFAHKGAGEAIELRVQDKTFRGKAPFDVISFAPRKISRKDLEEIGREFEKSTFIRDTPDEAAPRRRLSLTPGPALVKELKDGWIKVYGEKKASRGWVRARPESLRLSRLMPELTFVEGLVGYLRSQVGSVSLAEGVIDHVSNPVAKRGRQVIAERAADAFRSYRAQEDVSAAEQAVAMSEILEALCGTVEAGRKPPPCKTETWQHFRNAADLVPYSGQARNLEVMAHVCLAYQGAAHGLKQTEVADALFQAATLEPDDAQLLENLTVLYQLFQKLPPGGDPAQALSLPELRGRLALVKQVKRDLRAAETAPP